jgi:ABC-type lipoprotein release transport system permease subunit
VIDILLSDLVLVAIASILMAALASAIPLLRINRIDPAEVFRS